MNNILIKKKPAKRLARENTRKKEYSCKSDALIEAIVFATDNKRDAEDVIEVNEMEPTLDVNLFALIKDCKWSVDKKYIILIFDIFETLEPREISFAFNVNTQAVKFLLQNAKKFECFRNSGNFVDLIGCGALIKIGKVNGYLNLKVVKELEIRELDLHLMKLKREEDTGEYSSRRSVNDEEAEEDFEVNDDEEEDDEEEDDEEEDDE